jgi:hypothetical protein
MYTLHPEPGHYQFRYKRNGAWVAAKIERSVTPDPHFPCNPQDRSPVLRLWIDGREWNETGLVGWWPTLAKNPIEPGRYEWLLADAENARRHRPDSPQANPKIAGDFRTAQPDF